MNKTFRQQPETHRTAQEIKIESSNYDRHLDQLTGIDSQCVVTASPFFAPLTVDPYIFFSIAKFLICRLVFTSPVSGAAVSLSRKLLNPGDRADSHMMATLRTDIQIFVPVQPDTKTAAHSWHLIHIPSGTPFFEKTRARLDFSGVKDW